MKKNKAMRLASALLVLTLLTTCVISSTFAKYVTSANSSDSARVAKWGFQPTTIDITDLFKTAYDKNVQGKADVIAPGTTNSATFGFTYGGADGITAPEVAYTFVVSTNGSSCDESIQNNTNIKWYLDKKLAPATETDAEGSWNALLAAIEALDGDKSYNPGELPDAFNATGANEHTVGWEWLFETSGDGMSAQDTKDTEMGNATTLANVTLKITVTATQVD